MQFAAPCGCDDRDSADESARGLPQPLWVGRHLKGDFVEARMEGLPRKEQPEAGAVARALGQETDRFRVRARGGAVDGERSASLQLLDEVLGWVPFDLHEASLFRRVARFSPPRVHRIGVTRSRENGSRSEGDETYG